MTPEGSYNQFLSARHCGHLQTAHWKLGPDSVSGLASDFPDAVIVGPKTTWRFKTQMRTMVLEYL